MIDLGRKESEMYGISPEKPSKNKMYYPSFHVEKDLGLFEKDVGKEMTATVKLLVKSVEKRVSSNNGKRDSSSFDVKSIDIKKSHYKGKDNA